MTVTERLALEKFNREHALKEHWKKQYRRGRLILAVIATTMFAGGFVLAAFDVQVPNIFELMR
ncbi:MAG: hypothetical protein KGI54_16185 [Pseudomonadota bacterium]|nr:hypothetical protein [Pseudomonadota bacterium]